MMFCGLPDVTGIEVKLSELLPSFHKEKREPHGSSALTINLSYIFSLHGDAVLLHFFQNHSYN